MTSKNDSFEKKLEKLETIVEELEAGELDIEDAISRFEEGMKLSAECQKRLEKHETKVKELIQKNASGASDEKLASEENADDGQMEF